MFREHSSNFYGILSNILAGGEATLGNGVPVRETWEVVDIGVEEVEGQGEGHGCSIPHFPWAHGAMEEQVLGVLSKTGHPLAVLFSL